MTNNTASGAKKHRESTEPESHPTAKMFFFFLLGCLASYIQWNGMVEWNSGMDYWNGGMLHRTYLIIQHVLYSEQ